MKAKPEPKREGPLKIPLKFDDAIDDFRAIAARGAASVVLWLTDQLPKVIDLPDETVE